jgi:hypothetical protein
LFAAICGGKKDLCVCSTKFETGGKNFKGFGGIEKEFVFLKYKTRTTRATGATGAS